MHAGISKHHKASVNKLTCRSQELQTQQATKGLSNSTSQGNKISNNVILTLKLATTTNADPNVIAR